MSGSARTLMPMDPEPTPSRFVHKVQASARRAQRAHDFVERLEIARDHPIVASFAIPMALGNRDVNRFFVDIQPYEHATVPHDLPPRVWHCAKRQTLRIIHDVTRGRSTRFCCAVSARLDDLPAAEQAPLNCGARAGGRRMGTAQEL